MATGTIKSNGWKTMVENQAISTTLNYPSEFNELLIICNEVDTNLTIELLIVPTMKNTNRNVRAGYYVSAQSCASLLAELRTTISFAYYKNGNQLTTPKISAYYR